MLWLIAVTTVAAMAFSIVLFRFRRRYSKPYVRELFFYPIKSCSEVSVRQAKVTQRGFAGDRILQVSDQNGRQCTPRNPVFKKLFHLCPHLDGSKLSITMSSVKSPLTLDLAATNKKSARVYVGGVPRPEGGMKEEYDLLDCGDTAAKWLQMATGISGCRLHAMGKDFPRCVAVNPKQGDAVPLKSAPLSLADEAPFLLTSVASLADLNQRLVRRGAQAVDMRRFRPNIVVHGVRPWEEDTWRRIRIGAVEFWVWQHAGRCSMTTIDRDSLERCGEPLKTLATFRERANGVRNFGMHLVPAKGLPAVGAWISTDSPIEVLEYDETRRAEWKQGHA